MVLTHRAVIIESHSPILKISPVIVTFIIIIFFILVTSKTNAILQAQEVEGGYHRVLFISKILSML